MAKTAVPAGIRAALAAAAIVSSVVAPRSIQGADSPGIALTGQVTSEKEGPMEGVLVSAKGDGSTITITVVSDEKGRYSFPSSKVGPGHYALRIRSIGYELDSPKAVDVAAGAATTADIRLRPTRNLPAQMSNAEWMISMPGTDSEKRSLLDCVVCHSLERVVRSTHTAEELEGVIRRMSRYANGSTATHPRLRMGVSPRSVDGATIRRDAEWLAKANLSASETWEYPLKTLPRPTGRATRVVITEYDLPRKTAQPHDVVVDSKGMAWYSDFGEQFMGTLDPKTGKATEYPIPLMKPGFPTGSLEIELDKDENLWLSMMYQGGVAKFDRKTEKIHLFPLPKELQSDNTQESMVMPLASHVDGKVWTNNQANSSILRLDVATGTYENFGPLQIPGAGRQIYAYGIQADHENNLYLLEYRADHIGRIDAKTKAFKAYPTPTRASQPRRGSVDAHNRLWFAEFGANAVAMFDPKTEKIQEYKFETPWSAPYQAMADKNGDVWTGSMFTDRVIRLNPGTGQVTEYLLPKPTNIRSVFVDNSTTPVTFWVGSNHGATVIKLEPSE